MGTKRPDTKTGTLMETGTGIYMVIETETKLWTGDWIDMGGTLNY